MIDDLAMSGSLKLVFPGTAGPLQAVWLNTAGGVTGGDRFETAVSLAPEAAAVLTSQAAERIYRALPGETGRIETSLSVGAGGSLSWLPQETILYDGAALDRRLSVDLASGARFLGIETLIFGRAAMGERVRDLRLTDRIDLRVGGSLVWADRLRLTDDADAALARPFVANGGGTVATLLFAAPGAASRLEAVRALLPATAGASSPAEDVIAARIVAPDGFEMRRTLCPLLERLSEAPLPRPWMI
ncbi:urease accessory protein UreD [Roseivivax sediminis]|uniref:urease accessory protein UreD n=1 Tax=Roseivivax sediminis TaxID=936889 RepID=UPI001CB70E3B|nr:urease accessory protein UreD [Roseivivax sediminis]